MTPIKLFSTSGAAAYLGLAVITVKYHIYVAKDLHPQKVGRTLVFTQEELDAFKERKRPPGRPPGPSG